MDKRKSDQPETILETRKAKILMGRSGGHSGKGSLYYRTVIPPVWAKKMGISPEERDVLLTFDGKKVVVEKATAEK